MKKNSRLPWEIDPALRPERLQALAVAAQKARDAAIDARDDRDNSWCVCCRAYVWTMGAITEIQKELLKTGTGSCWLRTKEVGLAFTFYIDNVPLKFYRGRADQPKTSSLLSGVKEMLAQGQLDFPVEDEEENRKQDKGWFWLVAIDTNVDGRTLEVVVFQANGKGRTRDEWAVPLDGRRVVVSDISDVRRDPVDQSPAEPQIPGDEAKTVGDDDDQKDDE